MSMDKSEKTIPAGRFKQQCLAIIDEVEKTHRPVVISKRGRPVARLVPLEDEKEIEARILGELRSGGGRMLVGADAFIAPNDTIGGWNAP